MSLKAGMIGLPGCGKTTIFNALTSAGASERGKTELNRAVVAVPDERLDKLVRIYQPLKTVPATVELVDIPGIAGNAGAGRGDRLLGHIKDVDALLHVVRCFPGTSPPDPEEDAGIIDLEMTAADARTLSHKIERLEKKSRSGDKEAARELEICLRVAAGLGEGIPARRQNLDAAERAAVFECHLCSLKPVLYVANLASWADAAASPARRLEEIARAEGAGMIAAAGRDEADLAELEESERADFMAELGIPESSAVRLIRSAYLLLGLVTFFTSGPDECRAWTCREGDTAQKAAGKIHTDMEKGFIRMEVIRYADLIAHGSEEAVAKAGLKRLEGKEYLVADGDIVVVRHGA